MTIRKEADSKAKFTVCRCLGDILLSEFKYGGDKF